MPRLKGQLTLGLDLQIKELYHVQMPTGGVNWTASTQPSSSLQHEATLRPSVPPVANLALVPN